MLKNIACQIFNNGQIEDEFHFVRICKEYENTR